MINVIKRDGTKVPLDISKWQAQIEKVCYGVPDVSQSMIEMKSHPQFYDGITTREIDSITLRAMVDLIDIDTNPDIGNVNYQYVAGKQRLSMLRKDVYGKYEPDSLYDIIKRNVATGLYTDELLSWYTESEWNQMEKFILHSKDEKYTFSAIEQLIEKYLVKNKITGKILETPQIRYIVASATVFHAEKENRMKYIKEYYESASNGEFTLATPVLAGLGTPTKQFSSCFPAGQKVWTPRGETNIEDISVGEYVMSHDGTYQKVVATRVKSAHQKSLIKLDNVYSLNKEFVCTDDHLIMALKKYSPRSRKNYSVPEWTRADNLEIGDYVQIPYSKYIDPRKTIKLSEEFPNILAYYVLGDDGVLRKPTTDQQHRSGDYDDRVFPIFNEIKLSPNLFRLLGYFAAEGHVNKNSHSVGFTLATKEENFINDIETIIKDIFSVNVTREVRSDNSTSLVINSYAIKELLLNLVGTGFNTKFLHDIVMRANKQNQENFLIGVIRGDGCVTKNGLTLGMSNRQLIRQISQIMLRCGLSPVMNVVSAEQINQYKINRREKKQTNEKDIITRHDNYIITLGLSGNLKFLKLVDKNSKLTHLDEKTKYTKPTRSKIVDGMYFAKVRNVTSIDANGVDVYDLQVDNVQSFTVNGVGVHNCVLIKTGDTLDSIFASGEMVAKYASKRAGIGLEVGATRRLGAPIRGGEIKHTGLIPFLKKWFHDLRSCSQGGIRNSSATVFYPIWHHQFQDLIVLKNNQGTEETRVRHMDYGVVTSNLFWNRFSKQENITFFDPNEVPELYNAFYEDIDLFNELYPKYEKRTDLNKHTMSAEDVFKSGIIKERTDIGRIYLVNIDNVQKQGPFDTKQTPIYQSNLCLEILLPTKEFQRIEDESGRIALCTLGSINLGAFKHPKDMEKATKILHRALNNILDYQDFLSIQSKLSNEEIRPIGIGITNLAYFFAKRGMKYGEASSLKELKLWMEHISYYTTQSSVELAKTRGKCLLSDTTYYGKGIFPWERRNSNVDTLTDFTPTLDWETLRQEMKTYGVRNATNMAVAPVESSSVVINSTNGMEMPMSLVSIKDSKSGVLIQVVPEYNKLKNKYQLMWEQTDCLDYIKTCAVIGAYTDQSMSTNTFYNPAHYPERKVPATLVAKNIMLGFKYGLKTFYYSLINKEGAKDEVLVEPVIEQIQEDDSECESCKL